MDELAHLKEQLHYANGTCELAMKHRDDAEKELERLKSAMRSVDYRVQDGNPYNDGWNAALDAIQKAYQSE